MNRTTFEAALGVCLLCVITVVSTGPSYALGASAGGACANCNGASMPECQFSSEASSTCTSAEIVSDCTGGANNYGVCMDDQNDPPDCHDACGVDNEYCEDDETYWP